MIDMYTFCINTTWIIFPLMIILIYEAFSENLNNKKNNIILDFSFLTALYLITKCSDFYSNDYILGILIDTIIILAYVKKQTITATIISIMGIIILFQRLGISIYVIMVKYITYLIVYLIYKNKYKNFINFTVVPRMITLILVIIINDVYTKYILEYIIYTISTYVIIMLFLKAEKIIEINMSYKELRKEKQLRDSLFKISHEIKNPIAVCKGYLDMYEKIDEKRFQKYIPIIKSEINRTLNILQDFSSCNKIKVNCDILDIELLLEDITNNFKLMFDNRSAEFFIELTNEEIFINGDYNRLSQVFVNIIKNSIEAIDENKKSYIKIHTEQLKNDIKIYVEDNGIGISKDNMEKIKEPFFTTKSNGTGLGTVLAIEIIEAHNGTIEYESEEGIGTTVIITLPLFSN